jgi:hypothetical protein
MVEGHDEFTYLGVSVYRGKTRNENAPDISRFRLHRENKKQPVYFVTLTVAEPESGLMSLSVAVTVMV